MVRKTRKRYNNAGTIDSAANIKATVIAVKRNSKTIKYHEKENNVINNRIDLLESIVKKQEKQIDTLNTIMIERLILKLDKALSMGYPIGTDKQRDIEYAIKALQGRTVEKPNVEKWRKVLDKFNQLKGDWITVERKGPEGFQPIYK